jgi:hypothetical protein
VFDVYGIFDDKKHYGAQLAVYMTQVLTFKGHTMGAKKALGFDVGDPHPYSTHAYAVVAGPASHKSHYPWYGEVSEMKKGTFISLLFLSISILLYLFIAGKKNKNTFSSAQHQGDWSMFSMNTKEKINVYKSLFFSLFIILYHSLFWHLSIPSFPYNYFLEKRWVLLSI